MFNTPHFAQIDVALRQGKHLSRHDYVKYDFIAQHFEDLERFYVNYGCRLIQHPDGFFFLLSRGGLIPSRKLTRAVMHLGQFIALKTRDPELTRTNGRLSVEMLVRDLETSIPAETLSKVYAPKQKEVLVGARVHEEVMRSLRVLEDLGFVERIGENLVPLEAIQRFVEVARHGDAISDTARLSLELQRGVVFDDEETGEEELDDDRPN